MLRRTFLLAALGTPVLGAAALAAPRMQVTKSPTCGCCGGWVEHARRAGFAVDVDNVSQDALWALKRSVGVTDELAACHTARIDGYFIEGHVPMADIHRLLSERPDALGIAVPGMPTGSPGMEMGDERDAFETILVLRDGRTRVFARHG